ncbi:ATP-grasp peptide maturase system methyltransferase [Streptomyces sp. NPDC006134]|uniref:ATP-grasp peptide maturase system methyltransferase n=1 Tax=Streptomyces sp. NPDC006134 TaxID=3154467 RepID=UPI0033D54943
MLTGCESDAARLRESMVKRLVQAGVLEDPAWRAAVEEVPRHRFVPGFYLPADRCDARGLTVWEPITAELDRDRWLTAAYSDMSLVTQFVGEEPDWSDPHVRRGGTPTSSSAPPSFALRMWEDAEVTEGHTVLEIGTGTGYSTALACERLDSSHVTSVDVDPRRLAAASNALHDCGYAPTLAAADGTYGYWPEAWFDRIVTTCSFRTVPPALIAQTRPGGKILLTLSGWLHGHARALLTVAEDGTAEGPLVPGTVSFLPAPSHAAPPFGNPGDWAAGLSGKPRAARHRPERLTAMDEDASHLRFLVQNAVPAAQMLTVDGIVHVIDVSTGSAATLTSADGCWQVREGGPVKLWERVEQIVDSFDDADRPGPESFTLHVRGGEQRLWHPQMPAFPWFGIR